MCYKLQIKSNHHENNHTENLQNVLGAILQSELSKTLIVFILMTDGDYSQEVNKMSEHEIYIDHSFTRHLSEVICGFARL